jgi:hypothetical protein
MSSIAPSSRSKISKSSPNSKSSPTSSFRKLQYKAIQRSVFTPYTIPTDPHHPPHLRAAHCSFSPSLRNCAEPETRYARLRRSPKAGYQLHDVRSLTSLACSCYGLVAVSPHGPCVRLICTSLTVPAPESFYPTVFSNPSTQNTEVPSPWRRHRPSNHNVRRRRSASECPETATKAAVLWWSLPNRSAFLSVVAVMLPGMLPAKLEPRQEASILCGPALRGTRPDPWTSSIYRERSFWAESTEIQ